MAATTGHLLGIAINRLRGRVSLFEPEFTNRQIADALETAGIQRGLFDLDDLHHAPACRANRWSGQCLPTGPCTCGAARAASPKQPGAT